MSVKYGPTLKAQREQLEIHSSRQIEIMGDVATVSVTAVRRITHAGKLYEPGSTILMRSNFVPSMLATGAVTVP